MLCDTAVMSPVSAAGFVSISCCDGFSMKFLRFAVLSVAVLAGTGIFAVQAQEDLLRGVTRLDPFDGLAFGQNGFIVSNARFTGGHLLVEFGQLLLSLGQPG